MVLGALKNFLSAPVKRFLGGDHITIGVKICDPPGQKAKKAIIKRGEVGHWVINLMIHLYNNYNTPHQILLKVVSHLPSLHYLVSGFRL